eukprot:CAMPEP_0178946564 /NCGR_PEP_ID=MMETSP0789-20121207/4358_1 /TAXON_ID=3005 /ORGANISM="Rhizosolenia setigera, Strain CCMP 1694" /LENGTH=68 /DNA_ID=CAMNT_0020626575 /DNA_START=394 /DNA_END=600 /DNA_ORIENTATION=+
MANTGTQGFNHAGYGLSVRDITGFIDAGHDLRCEARLLAMAREIRKLRAAIPGKGRSETGKRALGDIR